MRVLGAQAIVAAARALAGLALGLLPAAIAHARPPAGSAAFAVEVRASNVMTADALGAAGRAAALRLSEPGCARVLSEFADEVGRSLQRRLDALGASAADRPPQIYFYDGAHRRGCQGPHALAVTEPGSRVVHVCPRFVQRQRQDPTQAPVVLIHEVLHALGLAETSHSSEAITRQVRLRCGG